MEKSVVNFNPTHSKYIEYIMALSGKKLIRLGYPEGPVIGLALSVIQQHYKKLKKEELNILLKTVLENPSEYTEHEYLGSIAKSLLPPQGTPKSFELRKNNPAFAIYGGADIEPIALNQMETAMCLPIAQEGALMPDAHPGYGLPIGGVLATQNAVIPYGVGVDIGCRMCMSIYDLPTQKLEQDKNTFTKMLMDHTRFGHATFQKPIDHAVLERKEFKEIPIAQSLKDRAYKQIGSSGGGNHFVEFGLVEIVDAHNEYQLPLGEYLAVLSHSGSRGLGASIANYYTKLAMQTCQLPQHAKHLAWLDLDSEAGQEYWLAMNLAGDYASACHHQIHERLSQAMGEQARVRIENHHNFAWKEQNAQGDEIIVHRKGATPAGKGALGIIPGSMTSPGFIVRGKGNSLSINSTSHGAGRVMSRTKAKKNLSAKVVKQHLQKAGITLIGSGLDEAPMVYKDIHQVMAHQKELVEIIGKFIPKIVRMCGDHRFIEVD
ncbi:RtcB family protein [Rapidithrix thailandica]|uniref:3'-phosphate/5'-hydroxy nucleic acid ligase n=1 Tax=Rapidithrix thailandica TaxID=413964 RepID=A0AAW9S749_9BACT